MVKDRIRPCYGKVFSTWYTDYKLMFLSRNDGNNFQSTTKDTTQALSLSCDQYDTYQRFHHYTTGFMQTKWKLSISLLLKGFHTCFRLQIFHLLLSTASKNLLALFIIE